MERRDIETPGGRVCVLEEESAGAFRAYRGRGSGDNPKWAYGTLGTREATLRVLTEGRAPSAAVVELYDAERERLRPVVERYEGLGAVARRRKVYREEGDEIAIERLLERRPECWTTTVRDRQAPCVRLVIDVALSCGNSEAQFGEAVAVAAAACDVLGAAGIATEVLLAALACAQGCFPGARGAAWVCSLAPLKLAEEPLDVHRLLSCGAPGLLRDCVFGQWIQHVAAESPFGNAMRAPSSVLTAIAGGRSYWCGRKWRDAKAPTDALAIDGFLRDVLGEVA